MTGRQSQCTQCHRYLTGSPSLEVGHQGAPGDSVCTLQHHPRPCPWIGEDGTPCPFYPSEDDSHVLGDNDTGDDVAQLRQQLQELENQREEERRRAELLELANTNLTQAQQRLQQENLSLRGNSLGSLSSLSTTTITTPSFTPRMGTGYSASFSSPLTTSVMSSSVPHSVPAAVSALVAANSMPASQPALIYGYSGPTIPKLRSEPQVNAMASQYLSAIQREIPALVAPSYQHSRVSPAAVPPRLTAAHGAPPGPFLPPGCVSAPSYQPAASAGMLHVSGPAGPPLLAPGGVSAPHPAYRPVAAQDSRLHNLLPQHLGGFPVPPVDPAMAQLEELQRQIDLLRHSRVPQELPSPQQVQEDQVQSSSSRPVNLDSLFNAHIKNSQYRAIDFAKLGKFPYVNQIKSNSNVNLALFSFGTIKHLLAICDGTLPPVTHTEFISRLQHLLNVFEITCLGSNISDLQSYGFSVARDYNEKIVSDIEVNLKSWETLDKNIDAMAWAYSKELNPRSKPNLTGPVKTNTSGGSGNSQKLCTTFNTFRKEGCHFEHQNPGETCVYLHNCSRCRSKGLQRKHKAWQCPDSEPKSSISTSTTPSSTAVTSA